MGAAGRDSLPDGLEVVQGRHAAGECASDRYGHGPCRCAGGKLKRLLADASVGTIVVEHRERLARFGVEYIGAALAGQGRRLVVIEEREVDDDLVRDVTAVLSLMCARLYGRRSAKRRAERAIVAAAEAA